MSYLNFDVLKFKLVIGVEELSLLYMYYEKALIFDIIIIIIINRMTKYVYIYRLYFRSNKEKYQR